MAERRDERKRRKWITREASTLWPNSNLSAVDVHYNFSTKKRFPFAVIKKRNCTNICVTNKTPFKAQLLKCDKFFDAGASEVIIHGLGAAINRACNIALKLKEIHWGSVDFDIRTSTANLIDDLEPVNDEVDYETRSRNNSSVHIRVFRTAVINTIKYAQ